METRCIKIKIKKDHLDDVRTWFQTLKIRINETIESLENERVFIESVFLDKQGDDLFLIYYMKAENFTYAINAFRESVLPIDLYHKKCMENFCERREVLEELMDIDRRQS